MRIARDLGRKYSEVVQTCERAEHLVDEQMRISGKPDHVRRITQAASCPIDRPWYNVVSPPSLS